LDDYKLYLKEKDRPNFALDPYSKMIMNDNYIIKGSKIFYLYRDHPLEDGILDMEVLEHDDDQNTENPTKRRFA